MSVTKKIDTTKIKKILVIQLKPFGDVLLTTAYFETLKNKLPQAKLYYLVKEPFQEIVANHPFIDEIIAIKKEKGLKYAVERIKIIKKIRREKFDLVIDQQNMPSSQQLTLLSGAKLRVGYADARFSFVYNIKAKRGKMQYSASRKYELLAPLGIGEEPYKLYFPIKHEAHEYIENWASKQKSDLKKLICISPGSPVKSKIWNLENYAQLADSIHDKLGYKVVLSWAPQELKYVEIVRSKMKTIPIVAPSTDLCQAAALLTRCKLLICNDGGLNHLSVATGTTTLAIFGSTSPEVWSPASVFPHHFHLHNPNWERNSQNDFGISFEEVFEQVKKILAQ